jgi:hypothetical protein
MNKINPRDYLDTPLWCVYGSSAFPQIICCKVLHQQHDYYIWGLSKYKGSKAFRTLGVRLDGFIYGELEKGHGLNPVMFFNTKEAAFDYLSKILTP